MADLRSKEQTFWDRHARHDPLWAILSDPTKAGEALAGKWRGSRSSRLGDQWRLIYRVIPDRLTYEIASLTPHDYRRQ